MVRSSHPLFAISVAAELSGTSIQNLRSYERNGLLLPSRSEGGTRRYSQDDVDALLRIRELLDGGLNLAGVQQVLALETEVAGLREELERKQE
jgi:MerR family transcriptional regulator/heat shock protein HspR